MPALAVDDSKYLHKSVTLFYLSWYDMTAYDKMLEATEKMMNGERELGGL